jgi:cell division protein FtsI/penicillin-binding protein 2
MKKPEAGLNLGLTIDARITRIMEREMNIAESTYNPFLKSSPTLGILCPFASAKKRT